MSRDFERSSSQYLSNANAVVSGTPFTMACWFKSENVTNDQTLLSVGTAGADNARHSLQAVGSVAGDPVRAVSRTTGSAQADTTTGYTAGIWYHACGVWASETDRRVYIDGGSEGANTTSRVISGLNSTYIGAKQDTAPTVFMDGLIAEAAIWNVGLNTSEIAVLARGVSPLRIRPSALVAYWPVFGVGSPEPDYSNGGFHMTLNAAPPQADHAPVMPAFYRADWYGAFTAAAAGGTILRQMMAHHGD